MTTFLIILSVAPSALAANGGGPHKARPGSPNSLVKGYALDRALTKRSVQHPEQPSTVIVRLKPGTHLPAELRRYAKNDGQLGRLNILNAHVLVNVPNGLLKHIATHRAVLSVSDDRPVSPLNYRTALTVGARAVQTGWGYTGAGIGVAIIDSGITSWHDDLTNRSMTSYPYGNQRVSAFVDFVNGQTAPYDDEGHGTHVAGIIAGNGYDSNGAKAGIAPDASLVSLKVLDANGAGTISNIIAAMDWVLANASQYGIRVVNLSVGTPVTESYWTDPLTVAAKQLVDAGIVVVGAAGNVGKNAQGLPQYGAITAPGNAPWVLTVGASSTNGTVDRADDTMPTFSSRGPTYFDWSAKPDLVAPGVGTVSLSDPGGTFYTNMPQFLVAGSVSTGYVPYLSLSGTSMATPVVSGTVALLLQANPTLTPNEVKAILQYTAQEYPAYDVLTEGAGFLNTLGAVRLARFFATAQPGDAYPVESLWSQHIIWGNQRLAGGVLMPTANAWTLGTTWGAAQDSAGDNIVWGTDCAATGCDNIVWGTNAGDNIVWGTSLDTLGNVVWGTDNSDNIVWGTDCGGSDCDNIVWGTNSLANIVWGTDASDNIVWGTDASGNIVWSTSNPDNIVWGTAGLNVDNIVWGTDDGGDNIVWGTDDSDNIVWGTSAGSQLWTLTGAVPSGLITWYPLGDLLNHLTDAQVFAMIAWTGTPPVVTAPPPTTTTSVSPTDPTTAITPTTTTATPPIVTTPSPTSTTNTSTTTATDPTTGVVTTTAITTTTTTDPTTGLATTTTTTTTTTTDPTTGLTTTTTSTVTA